MKKLREIIDCNYDIDILGITDDSRSVKKGYLFVATKGFNVDHFNYVDDAINRGAVAVICDRNVEFSVPTIYVSDIDYIFVVCCLKFYGVDVEQLNLIGVTGTDGKTTVATLIKQILEETLNVAYIGTNGMSILDKNYTTSNTTPCISELYSLFSKLKKYNCKDISMEVSSEALLHGRVDALKYDIAIYTNITEDHLNIHKTIENYINTKLKLCNLVKDNGIIFVNGDDPNCKVISDKRKCTYGFSDDNDYVICDVKRQSNFVNFRVKGKGINYLICSPLIGKFNIYNVAVAFIVALHKGLDPKVVIERIKNIKSIDGRMESLDFGQNYQIILDYAHTYNSISSILDCFINSSKKIILVTGAAGGREKEKRAKIGKMILSLADFVIFTMDDPRYEKVEDIISQMIDDSKSNNYEIIIDRKTAIFRAFDLANEGDVVLILGKGRDNYMAIFDQKVPYCDYDVIKSYFC